jgi:hypothetical protein
VSAKAFARRLEQLERLASRPLGTAVLFLVALADYGVQAVAWPLRSGRDLDEYLLAYLQMFDRHALLPWALEFRTPITPLVAGSTLEFAGGALAEPVAGVLFALSVVAWSAAALYFGPRVALTVAVALLLYPGYALMFHEVASELVLATVFAGWALLVVRAAFAPSLGRFALIGLGVAMLALVRPGNAVLLAFALFPLVVSAPWRTRTGWALAVAVAAVIPLAGWSVVNGVRFGDYTLARGGNAIIPFYRAFITDHIVSPENGEQSQKLTRAMQEQLLAREPYRSYAVTLDELLHEGSFRVHEDLYLLSDQVFGWKSAYSVLRGAGVEGVRAHPGTYTSGVARTIWNELAGNAYFRVVATGAGERPSGSRRPDTVVVRGKQLPRPTEGQPIPGGQVAWISRPDQSIRQVWTSPTRWHFVFERPGDRRRFEQILRRQNTLFDNLPHSKGNSELGLRLNELSRWFPRPLIWIVLGLGALAVRRPRGAATLVALALAAFVVVLLNALGLFTDLHFMLPAAPAFILLGLGGLLGSRASTAPIPHN